MPNQNGGIPAYQKGLGAYHEAFAPEIRAMVGGLPIRRKSRVLDLACGDGTFARWLAPCVGPGGSVVAVDLLPDYLDLARQTVEAARIRDQRPFAAVEYVAGDVEDLPLPDGLFDLVWCAQSFRSLPRPARALRRMVDLSKPGAGLVAILENDAMHQVLLPWPVPLELAIRRAELAALTDGKRDASRYYVGRRLPQLLGDAGLVDVRVATWAANRQAPLSPPERTFLTEYLAALRDRVADDLEPAALEHFDRLARPASPDYLPDQSDLTLTCIDHVVVGRRPPEPGATDASQAQSRSIPPPTSRPA